MQKILFLLFLCVFAPLWLKPDPQRFEYFAVKMGTRVRIVLYADTETCARDAASAAFERIQKLDEIMTDYNPESELMRLSREGYRQPKSVSPDLFDVLEKSLHYSELTGGSFDITVGPLVALWREARRNKRTPDPRDLERAKAAVGYSNMILDRNTRTVSLRRSDMKLDLGGIAKGYAADQALAVLKARGILSALVAAGGDIAMGAPPPGQSGWRIEIQSPDDGEYREEKILLLHDCGVSTSGDTEQFVEIEGVRYSHIVNPRTGMGVRDAASATVVASDATTSDAWATALCALPPDEGLRLVESQSDLAACIVQRKDGRLRSYTSRRFVRYLAEPQKFGKDTRPLRSVEKWLALFRSLPVAAPI